MPKDDVLFPTECMLAHGQLEFIISLALAKSVTLITTWKLFQKVRDMEFGSY